MRHSVSPAFTVCVPALDEGSEVAGTGVAVGVLELGTGVVVVPLVPGMARTCPTKIRLDVRPLACWIAETLEPWFSAIRKSVSPDWTVKVPLIDPDGAGVAVDGVEAEVPGIVRTCPT